MPVVGGALIVGAAAAFGILYVLKPPAPVKPPRQVPSAVVVTPQSSLATLGGRWWSEAGQEYDAVFTGDAVELRIHDPAQFAGLGFSRDEVGFVLRAMEGEANTFRVEARIRPAPPKGESYEHLRAAPSCVVPWSKINGAPLKAELESDRQLVVQSVQITPGQAIFQRDPHDATRVIACKGLAEAHAAESTLVLAQHPPAPITPRAPPAHDAGLAGVRGSSCANDVQCISRHCSAYVCR